MSPEPILLNTDDGVRISGAYYAADQLRGQALLLHMMPATKESWSAFAFALAENGIASLAIDLRGHGESDGGPDGYRAFSDAEHQAKRLDVEAGLSWLRTRAKATLAIVGASIGANLAISAAAAHEDVVSCVALSPGLDYRGVTTPEAFSSLQAGQRLLVAVSEGDAYSAESVAKLEKAATSVRAEFMRREGGAHGTAMFEDIAFMKRVVEWLSAV